MEQDLQLQLFQHLKNKLPEHLSLVDEVASVLELSNDSAYRRIRGEKPLSLDEVYKLCIRFQLSLDHLMNLQSDAFLFSGTFVKPSDFRFDQYLQGVLQQVKYMNSFKEKKMYYLCKDIPLFHHFHLKEIAAFKHFFWMKTILQSPDFAKKKFRFDDYSSEYFELGKKSLECYNGLNSVELWNIESINSSIRQIEFHHESGVFESDEDVYILYEALERLVSHLEQQAATGNKFDISDPSKIYPGSYQMYFNEVILGDNSILAVLDGTKTAFLVHNVVNIIYTRDVRFTENAYEHIQNLMRKSTLISSVSERERARFFKYLRNRIASRKQNLKV